MALEKVKADTLGGLGRSFASPRCQRISDPRPMKGQMFLLASVIIVLGLISIGNLLGIYKTVEETRLQESLMLDKQLRNIKAEYESIAAAARLGNDVNGSAIRYLSNFSGLLRNTADVEVFYVFAYFNASDKNYSLTIGNYLKDSINVTVNASSSDPAGIFMGVIDDRKNETRTSAHTITSSPLSGTVLVNVTYTIKGSNVMEAVPVTISNRNYLILLYDIKVKEGNDFVSVKDTYNVTW